MYEPRKQFLPFHHRHNRWSCLVCHRRAGKTVACIGELLTRALASTKPQPRYAYIAPFLKQAKAVAWQYLLEYSEEIRINKNEAELWVEIENGARITIYGADNPDALRGIYLDGVVMDEFADMRPSVWGSIIRPLLADRKGWAVFIGTPKGHNAFYDLWREANKSETWFSLMLKASTSGLLNKLELEDAKRTMSDEQYEQEFECSFSAAIIGSYYGKLMNEMEAQGRITQVPYNSSKEVHTIWDLGGDGMAVLFYQMVGREPRIIDCHEEVGGTLESSVIAVKARPYNLGSTVLPHDAGHSSIRTGTLMSDQMRGLGMRNITVLPNEPIDPGIELMKQLLPRLYMDKTRCQPVIEAWKNYQRKWDEERKVFAAKPLHNWASHFSDAGRYLSVWLKREEGMTPYGLQHEPGHFARGMGIG